MAREPDIGSMAFHLTQVLTGHGCFADFLLRIGKRTDASCVFCGDEDGVPRTKGVSPLRLAEDPHEAPIETPSGFHSGGCGGGHSKIQIKLKGLISFRRGGDARQRGKKARESRDFLYLGRE